MLKFRKIALLAPALAMALLAGCDSVPQSKGSEDRSVTEPPAVTEQQAPATQEQPAAQAQEVPVSFFLAQEQQDEGLTELKLVDGSLWVLPEPLITRADLSSVEPRRTNDGQAFVRFGFSEQGAARLAMIARRFSGHFLLVAVGHDAVGLTRIAESSNGVLDIGMASDDQAIAVANAIANQPVSQQQQQPAE